MRSSQLHQNFHIESSKFGSFPPKIVAIFSITFIIFVIVQAITFQAIENWSFADALYFAIISISTVGYGDITPQKNGSKVLNILFTLISFCGLFTFFRVIIGYLVDHQIHAIVTRIKARRRNKSKSRPNLSKMADDAANDLQQEEDHEAISGRNVRWIIHLTAYLLWLLLWTLFYSLYKEEDFSVFNALYFGIITSTTIGYGQYTPQSNTGKIFCLITTMFGTLSLAILAGSLSQGLLAMIRQFCVKKKGGVNPEDEYQAALEKLLSPIKHHGQGELDKCDFVVEMLVSGKKCKKSVIQKLLNEFQRLDVNGDGVLNEKDFQIYKQNTLLEMANEDEDDDGGGIKGNVEMQQTLSNVASNTKEQDDSDDTGLR